MILIVDCGSTKVPHIETCLKNVAVSFQTVTLSKLKAINLSPFSAIIISGAPILLSQIDPLPYLKQTAALFQTSLPILGICFGHQIMAMHQGGQVLMSEPCRQDIDMTQNNNHILFKNLPSTFTVNQDHCEEATLPEGFTLLATSAYCSNEAMANDQKKWYGVQCHPETSVQNGQTVINNFLSLAGIL